MSPRDDLPPAQLPPDRCPRFPSLTTFRRLIPADLRLQPQVSHHCLERRQRHQRRTEHCSDARDSHTRASAPAKPRRPPSRPYGVEPKPPTVRATPRVMRDHGRLSRRTFGWPDNVAPVSCRSFSIGGRASYDAVCFAPTMEANVLPTDGLWRRVEGAMSPAAFDGRGRNAGPRNLVRMSNSEHRVRRPDQEVMQSEGARDGLSTRHVPGPGPPGPLKRGERGDDPRARQQNQRRDLCTAAVAPRDGRVSISVEDAKTGEAFELVVGDGASARRLNHPFAYAALRRAGSETSATPSDVAAATY